MRHYYKHPQTGERQYIVYSLGNKKLPESTFIFNLMEGATCHGKTKQCWDYCYARKATRMYPATFFARKNNTEFIRDKTITWSHKEWILSNAISTVQHDNDLKHVRIHEAGDFDSMEYFMMWRRVASKFSDVVFYCYTHDIKMLWEWWETYGKKGVYFHKSSPKFLINASTDSGTPPETFNLILKLRKLGVIHQVFHIEDNPKVPKENTLCIQDCRACNLCFNPSAGQVYITVKKH